MRRAGAPAGFLAGHRAASIAWLLLVGAAAARAQEADPVAEVAHAVSAAHREGDPARLQELATDPRADAWMVVRRLADMGEHDAAAAFAGALPARADGKELRSYAEGRRARRPDELTAVLALASAAEGLRQSGDLAAAAERYAAAGEAAEKVGWLAGAGTLYSLGGTSARRAADYARALELWDRRLGVERRRGQEAAVGTALRDLGSLRGLVGDYDGAMQLYTEALSSARARGDLSQQMALLQNMALVHAIRGQFRKAQALLENALAATPADAPIRIELLLQLADVLSGVGEHDDALGHLEEARRRCEARGDATGVGRCLGQTAAAHAAAERYDLMLKSARETVEHFRSASLPAERGFLGVALSNLGLALTHLGQFADGVRTEEEAMAIVQGLDDPRLLADVQLNLAFACLGAGELPRAEEGYEAVLRLGERLQSSRVLSQARFGLARVRLAQDRLEEAAREANAAMTEVEMQAAGLAEGQGAGARSRQAALFRLAVEIAARRGEPAEVFAAIERGRAMALLESLESREEIRAVRVPAELREAENVARTEVRQAQLRFQEALAGGNRQRIRERRADLDAARTRAEGIVLRIQREARVAAEVLYPRPIALAEAQRVLGPREALLSYSILDEEVFALVATAREAHVVRVGSKADISAACEAVAADPDTAAASGSALVKPLALPAEIERVLVSPDGMLFSVPFALLFPAREVAYVPSATTVARLRGEVSARGEGVLAVGDPAYEAGARGSLARLPATAQEASAVGSAVLLQADATVPALRRTLAGRTRWRAVHFACHGLLDSVHPMRSALALTPTDTSDGLLTALDLCELTLPADLAVLSACETGRGRVYSAEGLVGLARAALVAGAPRVIVSLWKVDDGATKALMVKFYELWNPGDGSKGLPAATALARAQEQVRNLPNWKNPRYWAAWQLWGLPD